MTISIGGTILGTTIILLGLIEAILELRDWGRRRATKKAERTAPPIYAVGSPEYHAQIVAAIREVNKQLAPEGKRVPERDALDILRQTIGMTGKPDRDAERDRASRESKYGLECVFVVQRLSA